MGAKSSARIVSSSAPPVTRDQPVGGDVPAEALEQGGGLGADVVHGVEELRRAAASSIAKGASSRASMAARQ